MRGARWCPTCEAAQAAVAQFMGVAVEEIAFTRNATEAMTALILQYNRLKPGDAVLYADLDYDSMQTSMELLARRRGVECHHDRAARAGDAPVADRHLPHRVRRQSER